MKTIITLIFLTWSALLSGQDTLTKNKTEIPSMLEQMPVFPGGDTEFYNWILSQIKFPAADSNCIPIKFNLSFTIDTLGKASQSQIEFIYTFPQGCEVQQSMRKSLEKMIEDMPLWTPGMQEGKKSKVRLKIPVNIDWK